MSNEELHIDGDFTLNIPHFEADFTENEQPKMQADFKIQTGGSTSFANITGDPYDNEALSDALNQKADTSTVETLSETVENNYTELDGKITDESDARTQADADLQSNIDDVADDLSIETDNRQTADADLQDNIDTVDGKIDTHIADKSNPHEVTKAQIGLGNVDNTSDLNKPISTATQTALNGKQNTISDLSEIRTNASNGQSAYNTIQTYGDIVTYDASNFATSIQGQKADTALQPNDDISELNNDAGYITSASLPTVNNSTITFQKNNVTVGDFNLNQPNNETINIVTPTKTSDLTNDSGFIDSSALSSYATQTDLTNGLATKQDTISDLSTIRSNAANGQSAYTTIQGYGDIVTHNTSEFATSAQGDLADTSIQPNDNITLLNNNAGFITGIDSTDVITALGYTPYDSTNPNGFTSNVGTVTSVNNTQPDANGDVTLTIPTVNDGILTITQNGTSKGTFSANQSTNDTIALTDTTYNNFTGADGTNAGSSGLVPAPSATDNDKYLKGDGTWASVSGGSSTDVQINGTSITSGGVANILTQTAYDSSSNKIATMSDIPADEVFVARYNVTTYTDILAAYNSGKTIYCIASNPTSSSDYNAVCPLSGHKYREDFDTGFIFEFQSLLYTNQIEGIVVCVDSNNMWSYKRVTIPNNIVSYGSSSYVGSSTIPVYLSGGIITSTTLSIASSRFDGQWVQSYHGSLVTATSAGSSQASISTYLPSDSYDYEVMFYLAANYGSSAGDVAIGNTASPLSNNCIRIKGRVRNTSASVHCTGIIPIKSSARIIYTQREAKVAAFQVDMIAYRRIGTNS